MNIIERLINSEPQVATMIMSIIILWIFALIAATFHGMEMALWLLKQKLANNIVNKKKIVFKEILFGVFMLSILQILLLCVIHDSNIGHNLRFEMSMCQYVVVFILGISLYPLLIWTVFRKKS